MVTDIFKNYLRTSRKKLGLTQRQVAVILGLESTKRISLMERGLSLPSYRDCVVFKFLFKRSFEKLWPYLNFEIEAATDLKIRRLIGRLEKDHGRSERRRTRTKIVRKNLAVIVDGLPEDIADVI